MRILLLLFLLALPLAAQDYPPVLIEVLGYDVLRHHFQKDERPVFSVLGGGRRSLMTGTLVDVPDSTQRATVSQDGQRRTVRVERSATRVYDLKGNALSLDALKKGTRYALAYYDAAEPIVTDLVSLEGDAELGGAPAGKPRTLPVVIGGVKVSPPQGWQSGALDDLTPRVYRGKLRPHLFVSQVEGKLDESMAGVTVVASSGQERLALWTFEDKVLTVRFRQSETGIVVALFCLLEDYRRWSPAFLELVGNLGQ